MITSPALVIGSYLVGLLLLVGALGVVLIRDMVRAALALLFTFLMIALVYALLSAEFLVAVQLVYMAAVTGLIGFAIMLTRGQRGGTASPFNRQIAAAAVVSLGIFLLLAGALWTTTWPLTTWPNLSRTDETLGRALLTRYAVPFEAMSVVLLAVLAGAMVLAVREEPESAAAVLPLRERRKRRRRRTSPQVTAEAQK